MAWTERLNGKPGRASFLATGALAVTLLAGWPAREAHADPSACGAQNCVVMWNETLNSLIRQTSALLIDGPPEVANQIAILGTSVYNAVNAATGMQYYGYNYTGGAVANADAQAAALSAGYAALMGVFAAPGASGNPSASSQTFGALLSAANPTLSANITTQINTAYTTALANLNTGDSAVQTGLALGTARAADMVNARNADGAYQAMVTGLATFTPMESGITPGVYIPPSARPAMYPTWGTVTPWSMTSSTQFDPGPPPSLTSASYAASVLKTECLGSSVGLGALSGGTQSACGAAASSFGLPASNGAIGSIGGTTASNNQLALFWNDPGTTIQPPGHWLQITDTAAIANNLDLLGTARITAMVGVGMADAGLAAWQIKYENLLWRPQDAIRDCNGWNGSFTTCEAGWSSLIATPPHPDYVAGHPTFSYAAATLLDNFFADGIKEFCSSSDAYNNGPGNPVAAMTICYDNFLDAASDATISRVYGGIHTDFASNVGASIGAEIADQILDTQFQIAEPASLLLTLTAMAGMFGLRRRRS